MTVELLTAVRPGSDTAEWEELALRCGSSPFVRPGWITAWQAAFGRGELCLATARRGGLLVGLVPLERTPGGLGSPTNLDSPEFDALHEDDEAALELSFAIFAQRPRRVSLSYLDAASPTCTAFQRAAPAIGYRALVHPHSPAPYVRTDGGWNEYEAALSPNLRNDVRRRKRRLDEAGDAEVVVHDGSERLDELLSEGFRVEAASWKGQNGTAIASRPETEHFYREAARWAAEVGILRLLFLRLDRSAIAFIYGFETESVFYYLKAGYDDAYARFAPGKVLAHAAIERAFSLSPSRFEFLGADEWYKLRWSNATRDSCRLQAFPSSPRGTAEWLWYRRLRPLAKRARAVLPL